ncbi:hypothetical protein [Roseivivax isoporae]|uniref:Uncharacterized protein n=1 Tax=Roseivivax isoporae LMG 25204 TaxID=1449351 RepID=X7FAY4_9RHOB|nr:hypothetical protein [Roseivivax isoporae]ETX30027.1 hypothetical protein RISW2_19890 [Roseivivax isoporae LMG 25204]
MALMMLIAGSTLGFVLGGLGYVAFGISMLEAFSLYAGTGIAALCLGMIASVARSNAGDPPDYPDRVAVTANGSLRVSEQHVYH